MMEHKIEKLDLKTMATYLQMRPQRLLYKAEKLGLKLNEHDTVQKVDVITLVQSYVQSKKTSTQTKQKALKFINKLNGNSIDVPFKAANNKAKSLINTKPGLINKQTPSLKWYKVFINTCTDFVKVLFEPLAGLIQVVLKNSVRLLESMYFKFIALIVAISVQMHHSAIWFQRVTPDENTSVYAAYGYAFMVDLFILVVTMEGKLSIAKTFAALCFLSNVLYFQFWVNFERTPQAYTNAISSLLISGIMAYIIYAYTELFVKYRTLKS